MQGQPIRATVIYDDVATEVSSITDNGSLWMTTSDLARTTRFELKANGVCRDSLCFPLPGTSSDEFVRTFEDATWFNLIAFAQHLSQPVAFEPLRATWCFGQRSDEREQIASLEAPDFTLPDATGVQRSLSDFRGKKVLLVTWASW